MSTKGWSVADIADLTGMTAVVTGANRGIGLEVARGLAGNGAHVVLAVRRTGRGDAAAAAIRAASPGASLEVMTLDLADLASVHRFAAAARSRWQALDLLVNNAGVGSASPRRTASTTWAPLPARPRATSSPMPRLAPVTTAVMPVRSGISAAVQLLVLMPACSPGRGGCWPDSATLPSARSSRVGPKVTGRHQRIASRRKRRVT